MSGGDIISSYSKQAVIAVILLSVAIAASLVICIMLVADRLTQAPEDVHTFAVPEVSSDVVVFSGSASEYSEKISESDKHLFDILCLYSTDASDAGTYTMSGYEALYEADASCAILYDSDEYSPRITRSLSLSENGSGFAIYALFESLTDESESFAVFCSEEPGTLFDAEALCSRVLCYTDYFPVFVSVFPSEYDLLFTDVCGLKKYEGGEHAVYASCFEDAAQTQNGIYCLDLEQTRLSIDIDDEMIALTYDDGPSPQYTMTILDTLIKNDAKATFFVMGAHVTEHHGLIKQAFDAGCEIGNHTNLHESFDKNPLSIIKQTIETANDAIRNEIGIRASLVRPPNGETNTNRDVFAQTGYPLILWNTDTLDYADGRGPEEIIAAVSGVSDGDIILMHDIHASSAEAAEELVELLCKKFRLVTASELLEFKTNTGACPDTVYRNAGA